MKIFSCRQYFVYGYVFWQDGIYFVYEIRCSGCYCLRGIEMCDIIDCVHFCVRAPGSRGFGFAADEQ